MSAIITDSQSRLGKSMKAIVLVVVLVSWVALVCLPVSAASVFTPEEGRQALEVARQYVSVQYEYEGSALQGVAYLPGGQDTVADYLKRVEQGAKPGKEAGVDASGLVINAYKTIYPQLQFVFRTPEDKEVIVRDVSSETLYLWNVQPVTPEDLSPGDLIFFGSPEGNITGVALYAGRRGNSVRMIVASLRESRVIETGIHLNGEYWNKHIVGAGRLLKW